MGPRKERESLSPPPKKEPAHPTNTKVRQNGFLFWMPILLVVPKGRLGNEWTSPVAASAACEGQ